VIKNEAAGEAMINIDCTYFAACDITRHLSKMINGKKVIPYGEKFNFAAITW
jgi:hypothetical protein